MEGLNSKVMSIKRRGCGYSNKEHFKTAIYFFYCGSDFSPEISKTGAPTEFPEGPVCNPPDKLSKIDSSYPLFAMLG